MATYAGCALLGPAGLGKTFETQALSEAEKAAGRDVREARLADLAQSAEGLAIGLNALSEQATLGTTIFLDALDEIMVPVPQAGRVLASWLRTAVRSSGASLRISCRSAVFPESVRGALVDVYGMERLAFATLQPLNTDAVETVARHEGFDARAFTHAIERANARALSELPLTLRMLLQVFRGGRGLPQSRIELFDQGLRLLVAERAERREEGTALPVSIDDLIDAAERLACYVLLSGRDVVNYSDSPAEGALNVHDLGRWSSHALDDMSRARHRFDSDCARWGKPNKRIPDVARNGPLRSNPASYALFGGRES